MNPFSRFLQEYGGLELLNRILRGELPLMPIATKLNFNLTAVSPGEVTFTGHPDESVYNLVNTVHGGYAATLLDAAMACAILTTLSRSQTFTTLEIKIQYLRAITAQTGEVHATGKLLGTTDLILHESRFDEKGPYSRRATQVVSGDTKPRSPTPKMAPFHQNPHGRWFSGRSAVLQGLRRGTAIPFALRLAYHPGKPSARPCGIKSVVPLHTGRKMAAAEGKIVDRHGKLLAHGTTTCMILPVEPKPSSS